MCGVHPVVRCIETALGREGLAFARKPLVIGGMAMEYYGLRPSGADIDLVVADEEYQALARLHAGSRKDIYGDLGVVLGVFEIWRSIALLDYAFLGQGALDEGGAPDRVPGPAAAHAGMRDGGPQIPPGPGTDQTAVLRTRPERRVFARGRDTYPVL